MASLLTIKLNKSPGTSWGIRLQGGKDFASPLCIQKVNSSSVAEKSGLQAGDAVVSINGHDVYSLRHKEAQDLIVKAGNNFDMVVQRGMQTWRPTVTPLQEVQRNPEGAPVATKTSLAATPQKPVRCIGSNYNCVPRPFPGSASLKATNLSVPTASTNGRPTSPDSRGDMRSPVSPPAFSNGYHSPSRIPTNDSSGSDIHYRHIGSGHNVSAAPFGEAAPKQIVNAQFNSPINIYSEDAIAETLSAQAEVLSKGVVGINFKKYDKEEKIRTDSPTYRLLHGEEDEPTPRKSRPNPAQSESGSHLPFQHDPTEHQPVHHQPKGSPYAGDRPVAQGYSFKLLQQSLDGQAPQPTQSYPHAGHVPHAGPAPHAGAPGTEGLQPGDNICAGCERLITGVFVRVKNKNLHADCFKCATCGSSLKNVGYYNINEKLYCDIHAKQAVRQHPPAPNMVPVTVQPGNIPPAGAMTSPQARAVKAPFQSKIPSAGFSSPAPIAAPFKPPVGGVKLPTATFTLSSPAPYKPAPPVQPEPFLQEPFVPAPAPVPEPTFPEPILEPQPVSVEEVEEPPAPPLDESEPPQEVEVLPTHEEDISVEEPQSQEVVKDSVSEEAEVDSKSLEQVDAPEIFENHVQQDEQETNEHSIPDYENLPQDESPLQLPDETGADDQSAAVAETETEVDSHPVHEEKAIIDESININGVPDDVTPEIIPESQMEKPSALETAPLLPFEVKLVGKGVSFETQQVLSSSYSKHVSKEEHYVETKSSVILASDPSSILRATVAPAPFSAPAPSPIHKVAPPAHVPMVAPSFHSSANPQGFGAPAGDLNVRAHIPKKGQSFAWPPRRAVREDDEEAHPPAWAPCGEIPSVPKPVKPAGPPPKTPPLLPTPPPPKDYDVMVMKSSTPTSMQAGKTSQPLASSKTHPLTILKSKPAEAKPVPAQGPPPPLASRFPKPAPSYIIFGGSNQVATPTANDVGNAAPSSSSSKTPSGILKKASTNRSLISPPKLVPVTLAMPVVKFDTTPLQLSDPNIKPNFPKHAPAPVISALKTNTEPIMGFKPVSAPALPSKKVAPSGVHSVKHPDAPHPPTPIPVKSSLPASVPASAENVTPKPVPSNPSNLADAAPVQVSSFGSNFMPKPTPPPGGIAFPKLGGSARGFQAPGQKSAPRRGRGVMNPASVSRIPICAACQRQIRGPFVSALGKTWCPDHFICATETCRKPIIEMGFVEEQGKLYCEVCYESYLAPICGKCDKRVKGDCLNAVGKQFHPECFCCAYCGKVFGSGAFYLEDGLPYCETDWNDLFTTKCVGCNFPIEAGDRWVEALNNNYHSQCFKCSKCHKNLEGQSFFAKGGKPFCKAHAQRGF